MTLAAARRETCLGSPAKGLERLRGWDPANRESSEGLEALRAGNHGGLVDQPSSSSQCHNLFNSANSSGCRKDPKTKTNSTLHLQKAWRGASRGAWRGFKPFSRGLQGAWRGLHLCEAFKGLKGTLRGLRRELQGGFKGAWRGLEGGLRRASRGLQGGLKGAWRWRLRRGLKGGLKGAWEGLQGGFRRASRRLQGGLRKASMGLQGEGAGPFRRVSGAGERLEGGFKVKRASEGFKGASERFEGGLSKVRKMLEKGFWEGCAAWWLAPQTDHLRLQ